MAEFALPRAAVINFVHPSTFLVSGPTGCGKTAFVVRVFKESMLRSADGFLPERLVWLYGAEQPALFEELRRVLPASTQLDLHPGLNGLDGLLDTLQPNVRNVVVIDDLMAEAKDSAAVALLFTVGSHHANTSVIYIVQNFFEKGTKTTTISRNAHYIVLFKNPRNTTDVRSLATQMLAVMTGKIQWPILSHCTVKSQRTHLPIYWLTFGPRHRMCSLSNKYFPRQADTLLFTRQHRRLGI